MTDKVQTVIDRYNGVIESLRVQDPKSLTTVEIMALEHIRKQCLRYVSYLERKETDLSWLDQPNEVKLNTHKTKSIFGYIARDAWSILVYISDYTDRI